jgi:hypothetical protein
MKWAKRGLVFGPSGDQAWWSSHASVPFAETVTGDLVRVYFSGRDQKGRSHTGYFEGPLSDTLTVTSMCPDPVLAPGASGCFDDAGAMGSWLIQHGDMRYLYYIGWNLGVSVPFRNAIGVAVSEGSGAPFRKYSSGPIIDRSVHDPCFTASSCVLVENGVWRMWYLSCVEWERMGGNPRYRYHIKYAESNNGIDWERNGLVCIDFKSRDECAISRPCVLRDGDRYKMWYSYRGETYRIGYAESFDGIVWERRDKEVGIDVSSRGWDSEMVEYPFVFDHQGRRYMLYNGNGYGITGIGLAVLEEG